MIRRPAQLMTLRFPYAASWAASAGVVLALTGCPGSLENPGEYESANSNSNSSNSQASNSSSNTPCDAPDTIFTPTCGVAGCHNAMSEASAGNLDLASPGVATRLVNVPANEMPSLLYINPAAPTQSVIYTKLMSPPPFDSQMPLGTPLPAADVQCVLSWVESVASSSSGSSMSSSTALASSTGTTSSIVGPSSSSGSTSASTSMMASSSSSGSSPGGDAGGAVSFMTDVYPIISASCSAKCHTATTLSGGLNMSTEAEAFTNLTMGTSTEAGCGEMYVVANNASKSLFYQKVVGGATLPTTCGVKMPKTGTALTAAQQTTIEDWINGGANP